MDEMIREIDVSQVEQTIQSLLIECAYRLPPDYVDALTRAYSSEETDVGRKCLAILLEKRSIRSG